MKIEVIKYILLISSILLCEIVNHNPDPFGDPWFSGGWKEPSGYELELFKTLPVLELPAKNKDSTLPYAVDNSTKFYFRPVFSQLANECGQASGIGYNFTYEMNYQRNTNANFVSNQFPDYYTFNFLNEGDESNGSSYLLGWDIIRSNGCPSYIDYGGMVPSNDPELRSVLWMNGYDKYEKAMGNRIYDIFAIPIDTPEGLETLKRWLFDHGDGSTAGGLANFSAGVFYSWQTDVLPTGTEHENEMVVTKWHTTVNHGMTIAGYNDSIRYDYNGDGRYTNDLDINGDSIVDMRDWEKGALLMVNSWGIDWGNYGKCWVMYNTLGYPHWEGGIWTQTVHSIKTFDFYTPLLKLRTEIDYPVRNNLKIFAGISSDPDSVKPEKTLEFLMFDHSGGNNPMSGDSTYIDIGLDLTPLASNIENFSEAKIFLCVAERDSFSSAEGKVISMSVTDEWSNIEFSSESDKEIADNDTTYMTVSMPIFYNTPQIFTNSLPEIVPGYPYSAQLVYRGGRSPYQWNLLIDYDEVENTNEFPSGEFISAEFPHNNPDNDIIPVKLDFMFPFYGNLYDSIFVSTDGYICFENKYFYIQDEESLTGTKVIAPHAADLTCFPSYGNGVYLLSDLNSFAVVWEASMRSDETADLKFACKIFSDGRIEFYHGEDQTENVEWYCGISNGDSENYIIPSISNSPNSSNMKTSFITPEFPYGISINNEGIISGMISEFNKSWSLTVKITDWNGIYSRKVLSLSSATGINETAEFNCDLISNYPNPFNPVTTIYFNILKDTKASLIIYNSKGEEVSCIFKNRKLKKGNYTEIWEPENMTSGVYYYILKTFNSTSSKKMLYLK